MRNRAGRAMPAAAGGQKKFMTLFRPGFQSEISHSLISPVIPIQPVPENDQISDPHEATDQRPPPEKFNTQMIDCGSRGSVATGRYQRRRDEDFLPN